MTPISKIETLQGLMVEMLNKYIPDAEIWFPNIAIRKNIHILTIALAAKEFLDARGIRSDEYRLLNDKIQFSFYPAASIEDQPDLQRLWSRLLANALDPNFESENVRVCFIGILKELAPLDALILDKINSFFLSSEGEEVTSFSKTEITKESPEIPDNEYWLSMHNLFRLGCIWPSSFEKVIQIGSSPIGKSGSLDPISLTPLGMAFLKACLN
ncbi:Abi-alpha family protein [Dethiosulfovibrio salsuginis]|nr:Abi-alpha family protein [Dethiosulfovibrio salsuginis]